MLDDLPRNEKTTPTTARTGTTPAAERRGRIFFPLGDLWPSLAATLALGLAGGLLFALIGQAVPGLTLAASALWIVAFVGSFGVLAGGMCQMPADLRLRGAMLVALLLKFVLFGAGGILVWRFRQDVVDHGALLHLVVGVHLLPAVFLARWFFRQPLTGGARAPQPIAAPSSK